MENVIILRFRYLTIHGRPFQEFFFSMFHFVVLNLFIGSGLITLHSD